MITATDTGLGTSTGAAPVRIPIDAGIPQSFASPMVEAFNAPWEESQAAALRAANEKRRATQQKLDAALLNPDEFFQKNPIRSPFVTDPEREKKALLNQAFIRHQLGGERAPAGGFGYDLLRRDLAFKLFDGRGAASDKEFHAEIVKDASKRRDTKTLVESLQVSAFDDAMLPSDQAPGFAAWREKAKASPGYEARREADYLETWHDVRTAAAERVEEYREPLVQVWRAFRTDGNITAAAFDAWKQLPEDRRGEFLDAIAIRAKALPEEERRGFWANLSKSTELSMKDFYRAAGESAQSFELADPTPMALGISDAFYGTTNFATEETARKNLQADVQARRNFAADIRRIAREDYDPIKSAFGDGGKPGFWEGAAYATPGVVASSLTMAVPVVGVGVMAASMEGQAYEQLRERMLAGGMDDAKASQYAEGLAPFVAAPQIALEKVGFGIWSRKLPGFTAALDKLGDQITNRLVRGGVKTLAIGAAETGIETAQDLTSYAVQDIAAALSADVPQVKWSEALAGAWAQAPETFVTMLPLAILGAAGGLSRESRAAAFAASSPLERRALGITDADSARIDAAAANGQNSINRAVDVAMANRNPASPEAQSAAQELRVQAASQARATQELERLGYAPVRFTQTTDGISVIDSMTGEEIGQAPDLSGAIRIGRAHTIALDDMTKEQIAYLGSMMESTAAAVEVDPASAVEFRFAEAFDPDQATPEMAARYAAQVALQEQAEGGTGNVARSVFGYSVTEFAQGMRNTVNRLFDQASVTTVFHETFHGLRRNAHARGTITRAQELAVLRGLDAVFAGKTTRDGTQLRFIPEGMTDEQVPETLIDEAISEIAEMEVLRTRKGKGKGRFGVSRGVISRNLTALAKLVAPEAMRTFKAFIDAVRARWGLSLTRAIALKKAEREGKFDAANYQGFLDSLMGLDAQEEHDAGVREELNRILAMPDEVADDDIPFSIGRREITKETDKFDGARVGTAYQGKVTPTTQQTNDGMHSVTVKELAKQMAMLTHFVKPDKDSPKVVPVKLPKWITRFNNPARRRDAFIEFTRDNLLALYDAFEKLPGYALERSTHWYDGARLIADEISAASGLSPEQAAAIIAAFSPMKDWFQNVAMGKYFANTWANHRTVKISQAEHGATMAAMLKAAEDPAKRLLEFPLIEGKSIEDLWNDGTPMGKSLAAVVARVVSQTVHGLEHEVYSPEGESLGIRRTLDGSTSTMVWQSDAFIIKALEIANDGSLENISKQLGEQHKIRNFYNNIISPGSPFGDATIDTHAVNAAVLFPMGNKGYLVDLNFGGAGVAGGGNKGIYWLFHESLRQAAAQRGILPRQMQSITWEAVRGLFPDKMKRNKEFVAKIGRIWETSRDAESARKLILEGGIVAPEWLRYNAGNNGDSGGAQAVSGSIDGAQADARGDVSTGVRQGQSPVGFSLGRSTVQPSAGTRLFQGAEGSLSVIGPAAFSLGPEYGIPHRPNEEGPRAFDLAEDDLMPGDVYDHPEWYSAMEPKIIRETMTQLRRVKGKPDGEVTIYRAGPKPEMNPGDWISLSKEYARTHADAQDPENFKVWQAKAKAEDVRWDMNDLAEFGYFGKTVEAIDTGIAFSISAFHGTPHKVDKFTTEKIGTGEGAQAYGWGLYFAEAREVAETYKNAGEPPNVRNLSPESRAFLGLGLPNLYRVTLKVEDEDLLDWDKPLAEQSKKVKAAFAEVMRQSPKQLPDGFDPARLSGQGFLAVAGAVETDRLHDEQVASQRMFSAGIRGIRYLDGNSRADGKGSFNYVIFDEADIEILEENGRPVNMQAAAFSLGPADVPRIMAGNALARVQEPRRRTQAMSRIARDFDNLRLQTERLLHLSGRRRSKAELRQEANARQDLAEEEKIGRVWAKYGQLLADDDLTKIKAQPVHAYLADPTSRLRGRLMSKAAAIKAFPDRYQLHRAGEYDGAEAVSRSVFGGQLMPDQAAQELYEAGLISDPIPDLMWEALLSEQKSVAGMRELLVKAQEEIRAAKQEAKQEANEWLATQAKDQETNFSPKQEIIRSLRMLDAILLALPPEVRGKIGGHTQMALITTDDARLAYLKDKLAKADKHLETFLREQYAAEWLDLLRRARPDSDNPGERPTGRIAADAYDILRAAESAMGLSFSEGEAEADRLEALADHEDTPADRAQVYSMQAQMVRLTANWTAADAARREQAVMEGERIYFGGLTALAIENSRRRERLGKLRDSAITGTGKTGKRMERETATRAAKGTRMAQAAQMAWEFMSFGQLVNVLFGEESAVAKWANAREIAASNQLEDAFQAKTNAMESMLESLAGSRFGGEKLRHRMQTVQTITVKDALGNEEKFTDSQAITFLLMWRQEDGRRHMSGVIDDSGNVVSTWGWDDASAAEVERQLSPEGRAMMAFLGDSYGTEYGRINEVFRRIWNVSMPRHKQYAPLSVMPSQAKSDTIMDPSTGESMGIGMTPGSLKNRSATAVAEPDFRDAFQVYLTHARQMEHFIAYGEFARDMLGVINRKETRNAITAAGGPYAAATLSKWVDYFAQGGIKDAAMGGALQQFFGGALGRLSSAMLIGRVSVLAMQSMQLASAAYKMPLGAYLTRMGKLLTGRLGWGDAIRSEYIQRRLQEMPPVVRDAVRGLESGNPNRAKFLAARLGRTIAGADALFTAGTYAMLYDYHLKAARAAGVANPEATAHAEAERLTDQIAQPTRAGARSWMELSMGGQPAFRALWNFASDPRQKLSLVLYQAMRRDKSGWEKKAAFARSAAITWAVGGILQAVLRAIMRDLRDDEDDEVFDERHWRIDRLALQALTGPVGGMPFVGEIFESSTYALTGQFMKEGTMFSTIAESAGLLRKWAKGDADPLKDAETIFTGGAAVSGTSAAAASFMHVVRDAVGIFENFTGD